MCNNGVPAVPRCQAQRMLFIGAKCNNGVPAVPHIKRQQRCVGCAAVPSTTHTVHLFRCVATTKLILGQQTESRIRPLTKHTPELGGLGATVATPPRPMGLAEDAATREVRVQLATVALHIASVPHLSLHHVESNLMREQPLIAEIRV